MKKTNNNNQQKNEHSSLNNKQIKQIANTYTHKKNKKK